MVMGLRDGDSTRDRAQLVLVGSIAIAFIIIGLVVVFNTVLFTDNLAARGSVEEVEGASELHQQVDRDVPELVRHVENGTDANDELHENIDQNVSSTYNQLLAETYAEVGTVYVNVTYNASESTNGTRVVQDSGEFVNRTGEEDWVPVSDRNVSNFTMNVSVAGLSDTSSDNFTLTLDGDAGTSYEIQMAGEDTTGDGTTDDLILNQTGGTTCSIDNGSNGAVVVNVSNGTAGGSCTFDSLDDLSAPYTVEFENGTQGSGDYTFLVNGTIDTFDTVSDADYYGRHSGDSPHANHVLLEAGVELYYESRTVVYESNQTVTVREAPQ